MNTPFNVGIPVVNQYEELQSCLRSVHESSLSPGRVIVVDNGGMLNEMEGVELISPGRNVGCAASWNLLIKQSPSQRIVLINDDCVVHSDTFQRIMEVPPPAVVLGCGWSCFAIDPEIVTSVGPFDEGFWPVYYEDADYRMRLRKNGMDVCDLGFIVKSHGNDGGRPYQNLNSNELADFHCHFEKNKQRFIDKWGGLPSVFNI